MAWIHPDQAKARKAIAVPLNSKAVSIIRQQDGKHRTQVFSYSGEPIRQVNTKAWRKALKRAEIEDFRWHDLRHTWASWHVQNGTPLFALHELGVDGDGAALCAPERQALGALCRPADYAGHSGRIGQALGSARNVPAQKWTQTGPGEAPSDRK